jgi:hypothetical protein
MGGHVKFYDCSNIVRLFPSILLTAEPFRQKNQRLLLSRRPSKFSLLAEQTNLQSNNIKRKEVKFNLIRADAGNFLCCSEHIPGTFVKSLYSHIEVGLVKYRKLLSKCFLSDLQLCEGLICKLFSWFEIRGMC